MKAPIRITRGHQWGVDGYQRVYQHGKIVWDMKKGREVCADTSGVQFQVWLSKWLCGMAKSIWYGPERIWRHILARLWHDRLSFQYERGHEDGLREGLFRANAYRHLDPEEMAAVIGCTPYQARQLLDAVEYGRQESRDRLLDAINAERGAA